MRGLHFAMAVIHIAVEELEAEDYTLPRIIEALKAYTQAAEKAQEQKGRMN